MFFSVASPLNLHNDRVKAYASRNARSLKSLLMNAFCTTVGQPNGLQITDKFPSWLSGNDIYHLNCNCSGKHPTSSSAVAERPRDALWPSLVSLNKINNSCGFFYYRSDLPLRNVVFGVTLRLLVIHFVVVSHHQQTGSLTSD